MARIDAHQHFWNFDPVRDSWINEEMSTIQRDFLPAELHVVLRKHGMEGCVTVQSVQTEEENSFYLENAEKWDFIKGVVGWVDLQADNLEQRLAYYSNFKKLKGFRHVLQGESQRDFMLRPAFLNGIGLLNKYNFTYDILIYPDQLKYSHAMVQRFPEQRFVLDHIAKPEIKAGRIDEWKEDIGMLASSTNVFCKLSGMVTEANWQGWKKADFSAYLDVVVQAFGTERIMFGSDWPVCLVAATYDQVLEILEDYFKPFSHAEKENIFGDNAVRFYGLEV